MFKNRFKLFYVMLLAALVTGCSGLPEQQAFNHQANQHIKRVAIVKPLKPESAQVFYFNHPGMQFGLIGGLAAAAEFESKTTDYNQSIANKQFEPVEYLASSLEKEFAGRGFEVTFIETTAKERGNFMSKYPDQDVDAYLDSYFRSYGYTAGSPTAVYKPTVSLQVRLVEKESEAVLYANNMMTGESFAVSDKSRYIGHSEKFSFPSFDDLMAAPDQTVDGLKNALDRLAFNIANELVSNPQAYAMQN